MNFLKPHTVVRHFDIAEGMYVADFGAGAGFFTLPLSEKVGIYGKVYAVDRNDDLVRKIISEGRVAGRRNIFHIRSDMIHGDMLIPEDVDRVVIANAFFSREPHQLVLKHAFRHLKPEGKMILIDHHDPAREIVSLVELAGFVLEKNFYAGDYHTGLVFKKI